MRWQKQTMYVLRSDSGVIVGLSETIPDGYSFAEEKTVIEAYSASKNASSKLTEYQKKKIEAKRLWMGVD